MLNINGNASLDGTLRVNLAGGYLPAPMDVFYILRSGNDSITTLGVFANVGNGGTLLTMGQEGFFTVTYSDNDFLSEVRLSNFTPIVMPKLWIEKSPSGENAILYVKAKPNQTVTLMVNLDLNDINGWDDLVTLQADATGDASYVDPQAWTVHPRKFYRLEFNYLMN